MTKRANQPIVPLDSMTLIWGVRQTGDPEKIKHAKNLFAQLEADEAQIVLPSVVVSEFLIPFKDRSSRENAIARMQKRFVIAPFDAKAAVLAAELWLDGKKNREMERPNARICLRADTFIVATGYGHGARTFYTDDADCLKMAATVMDAKKLPTIPPNLFDY